MQTVYMTIGLPFTSKRAFVEKFLDSIEGDVAVVDFDGIQFEELGENRRISSKEEKTKVVSAYHKRVKEMIKEGYNVIMVGTHAGSRSRMNVLNAIAKNCKKVAIYFNSMYSEAAVRGMSEFPERYNDESIHKTYTGLNVPSKSEGWDEIIVHTPHDSMYAYRGSQVYRNGYEHFIAMSKTDYRTLMEGVLGAGEMTFAHILNQQMGEEHFGKDSIAEYTYKVYKHVKERLESDNQPYDMALLWSSLLHAVGREDSKGYDEKKQRITYGGAYNIAAQKAMGFLTQIGYNSEFCLEVAEIITSLERFQQVQRIPDESVSKRKMAELVDSLGAELFAKASILATARRESKPIPVV